MVSIMSSMSFCIDASISVTGSAGRRRTSSPYFRIGRTATLSSSLQAFDHGLDGVLRASPVELLEHLADAGELREHAIQLLFVQAQQLRTLGRRDGGRARFPGQHAHFSEKIPLAEPGQVEGR